MTARPVEPRPDLALMAGYHSPQLDVAVRLNTNEAPFPPPASWIDELAGAVGELDWNRYPDRAATELRAAIAALHEVDPGAVFAANGSNEVLQTLLLAYGGPGRSAAVFEPTYALHSHIARITGTAVLVGERDASFGLDPAEVDRVIGAGAPAIVFLCSPNNPTGMIEPDDAVAAARRAAPGLVVVDEAYGQFAPRSFVGDVAADPRLVVVRTFSKTWSMAAARLGYCIGDPAVVAQLEQVALPYHLDAFKQLAGRLALRHGAEMEERVVLLVAERERVVAGLEQLGVEVWPSSANFVLFRPVRGADAGRDRIGDGDRDHDGVIDGEAVWQGLVERSVLVRNCSSWPRLAGCLRVTIGTPHENDRFLDVLTEVLA